MRLRSVQKGGVSKGWLPLSVRTISRWFHNLCFSRNNQTTLSDAVEAAVADDEEDDYVGSIFHFRNRSIPWILNPKPLSVAIDAQVKEEEAVMIILEKTSDFERLVSWRGEISDSEMGFLLFLTGLPSYLSRWFLQPWRVCRFGSLMIKGESEPHLVNNFASLAF